LVFRLRQEDSKKPKKDEKATEKFLLCLTTELKERVKKEAHNLFGKRKGAESIYVEMVLRSHLKMNIEGVNET
jgi:hypothetical protein